MSTNYIDQITDTAGTTHDISEGDSTRIFRATCSTTASTAEKVATLDTSNRNFSLTTGVRVAVTFKYGNSAITPTLRVDGSSTGTAKTIVFSASASSFEQGNGTTYNTWGLYETIIFTYNGTYWIHSGSALGIHNAYALANSKTDEKVKVEELESGFDSYPILSASTGTTTNSRYIDSNNIVYKRSDNAVTTTGYAQLKLGNNIASGTAGNKEGILTLYGSGTGSASIHAVPNTSGHHWQYYLPLGTGATDTKFNLVAALSYDADRGSTTRPIYVAQGGLVALCSTYAGGTAVTLNGTSKAASTASFYAPETVGSSGQYLKSNGSGAPTWATISDFVKISGTNSGTDYTYTIGNVTDPYYNNPGFGYKEIAYDTNYAQGLVSHLDGVELFFTDTSDDGYSGINVGNAVTIASSMNGVVINNLVTPVNDTDAANKKYVDDNKGSQVQLVRW